MFVFIEDSLAWTIHATLTGEDSGDMFGFSVAMGASFFIVGAPHADSDSGKRVCNSIYILL